MVKGTFVVFTIVYSFTKDPVKTSIYFERLQLSHACIFTVESNRTEPVSTNQRTPSVFCPYMV